MDMRGFRVQRACHCTGRLNPSFSAVGRWHSGRRPVCYLSEHPALACLEWLKGMFGQGLAVAEFLHLELVLLEAAARLPDGSLSSVDPTDLPADWRAVPNRVSLATQAIGNRWLDGRESLALRVPSATLPDGAGWNLLLNPAHPAYPDERSADCLTIAVTAFDLRHYLAAS